MASAPDPAEEAGDTMRSRVHADLDRWERGELSLAELEAKYPGEAIREIVALHSDLDSLRTEQTPPPPREGWRLAQFTSYRPGRAKGVLGRMPRPAALAAALTMISGGLALGLEPVRQGVTSLFRDAVAMVAPGGVPGLTVAPRPPPVPVALPIRIGSLEDRDVTWLPSVRLQDEASITCAVVGAPNHGRAAVDPDCSTGSYDPDPDFNGTDTFQYLASNEYGPSVPVAVDVLVAPVNDPPVAGSDEAFTDEDVPVIVHPLADDSDPDGDSRPPARGDLHQADSRSDLVIRAVSGELGAVTILGQGLEYTPATNFYGVDVVRYRVWDGSDGFASGSIRVSVAPVNDPPAVQDAVATGPEDGIIAWSAPVEDVETDQLSCSLAEAPRHGKATLSPDCSEGSYVPDEDHNGPDSVRFMVTDGQLVSEGMVTLDVEPVNDPPDAESIQATGTEDSPMAWTPAVDDVDGDTLSCSLLDTPAHGQASVSPDCSSGSYIPDPNFHGDDGFSYAVSDGSAEPGTPARVTVSILPVNDVPVPASDIATTQEGVPVVISPLANDSDVEAQPLSILSVGAPGWGVITLNGDNTVTYTPNPGFFGEDRFSYSVSDPDGGVETGNVVVTVISALISIDGHPDSHVAGIEQPPPPERLSNA
jgi:large repetitive protein